MDNIIEISKPSKCKWVKNFSVFGIIWIIGIPILYYIISGYVNDIKQCLSSAIILATITLIYGLFQFSNRFQYPYSVTISNHYIEVAFMFFWKTRKRRFYYGNLEVKSKGNRILISKEEIFNQGLILCPYDGWSIEQLKEILMILYNHGVPVRYIRSKYYS